MIEVREDGKSSFAPELGAADDDGLAGRDGNVQVSGVGLAHLKKKQQTQITVSTHNKKHRDQTDKAAAAVGIGPQ